MKKITICALLIAFCGQAYAQSGITGFLTATFLNRNVYKTKGVLNVKKMYEDDTKISTDTTLYSISPELPYYIRYKVVGEDVSGNKYIKILPGVEFNGDNIVIGNNGGASEPEDYVFVAEKSKLNPNTHYLASSALMGKVITLPLRVRNEYFNDDNIVLQGSLSLAYGFGWKYKLGNHPYRQHYFNTILYAAGVGPQKHFSVIGINPDGTSAISAKTDEIAITYLSFGLGYEYDKFNIGVFAGKDKMFGKLKNWAYQDKWWFGIGLGYELFK